MHILIDEVKISASGFLKSVAKESNGWTRLPSTTHVPAETYIYDSDAKAETKDRFILDGSTYCYWYRNLMTRFYLMKYSKLEFPTILNKTRLSPFLD